MIRAIRLPIVSLLRTEQFPSRIHREKMTGSSVFFPFIVRVLFIGMGRGRFLPAHFAFHRRGVVIVISGIVS